MPRQSYLQQLATRDRRATARVVLTPPRSLFAWAPLLPDDAGPEPRREGPATARPAITDPPAETAAPPTETSAPPAKPGPAPAAMSPFVGPAAPAASRPDAGVPRVPAPVAANTVPPTPAPASPVAYPAPQADLRVRDEIEFAGLAMPRRTALRPRDNAGPPGAAPVTDTDAPPEMPTEAAATRRGPQSRAAVTAFGAPLALTPSGPVTPPPRRAAGTAPPTIRIGSLEVRVVPPPSQPPVPQPVGQAAMPPRPPAVLLARGFRSFGLPQA